MKVLVVFSALLVVASATPKTSIEKHEEEVKAVHKKCQDDPKTTVEKTLLSKLSQNEITEDEKLKVHMLCMYQGMGLITQEGKVNEEILKSKWVDHFDPESQEKLQKCLVNKENALETSWALIKCEWAAVGDQIKAKSAAHHHH